MSEAEQDELYGPPAFTSADQRFFFSLNDKELAIAKSLRHREGRCPSDVEHRQIKYRNNVIECDHGKLKRIIGATLGFKSMKTAYATIKGIEVMRALRKGQASAFYYGDPLGEMRLVSRVFEM
ncbi:DDE domain-containing protein [Klebsiella pneumoniae]|nr:DDE domain-containing protein [Klebsiella pneumoniae]